MVKFNDAKIAAFLKSPDPAVRAVLVYGPDEGLIRERARALIAAAGVPPGDPFRLAEIPAAALRDDPARLADEVAAYAMGGGRRVVRVTDATDAVAPLLEGFLNDVPAGGDEAALVVVDGGDLPPRSGLRKLFEGARDAAAMPCYADEGRSLSQVIREILDRHNIAIDREAEGFLLSHLGSDRMVTRGEVEKLALYVGDGNRATLADVTASIGDSAGFSLDEVAFAAADGDQAALDRAVARAFGEGNAPIVVLRAVARHFHKLHLASAEVAAGKPMAEVLRAQRVFFKLEDRFRRQLGLWSPERLAQALDILTEAELDCKVTAFPADAVCGRALMRLGKGAKTGGKVGRRG